MMAFIQLLRPANLFIAWLSLWWTARWCLDNVAYAISESPDLWLLSGIVVWSTLAGYLINDYYDRAIDAINRPDRPSVRYFSEKFLWNAYRISLLCIGILTGLFCWLFPQHLTWALVLIPSVNYLLFIYAKKLKCTPFIGNLLVAGLCALVLVALWFLYRKNEAVPKVQQHDFALWMLAVFAFLSNLQRELIKDMEDLAGDTAVGCRTLPALWGKPKTAALVLGVGILELLLLLGVLFSHPPTEYNLYFLFAAPSLFLVALPLLLAFYFLKKNALHRSSFWYKLHILFGVLLLPLLF